MFNKNTNSTVTSSLKKVKHIYKKYWNYFRIYLAFFPKKKKVIIISVFHTVKSEITAVVFLLC